MAAFVNPGTVKKFFRAVNPFAHTPVITAPPEPEVPHGHSFSCPCAPCCAHTDKLTAERLKRQGA